ncbi:MAG TPA: KUP/HAK/KT family potassium transporter [Stellaceae bacterium]|nr:KUP/HAK/KT family potassium transporter [Stellaceae bacterium]
MAKRTAKRPTRARPVASEAMTPVATPPAGRARTANKTRPARTRPAKARSTEAPELQSKAPVHVHAGNPWLLTLAAVGIVFGDIGTSPLYAFSIAVKAAGNGAPTPLAAMGIVSAIFWALIIMVSIKYVVFVMRADNDGEGGILALLAVVTRGRIVTARRASFAILLGILGAALLYGDGVITPAISVLSAIEGLKLTAPGIAEYVLPITVAILIGLFAIQRRGTETIGRFFGPTMVVWFVTIAVLGIANITKAPAILGALSPLAAARFLAADPAISAAVFGAVFLALTGGEALYADMGHVGADSIRRAWFGLVLPAVVLNYFGQGALIIADPSAADTPFFKLAPEWAVMPLVLLATAATVIASQALISGVFSLTRQAMELGLCPRARIVPTSADEAGQIYVPVANWMLMGGTILTVFLFRTSDNLGAAYGIAVSGTMLATTILLAYLAHRRWHWSPWLEVPVIALFGTIDLAFLCSNTLKIAEGGWFPIAVGGTLATLMLCWRRGMAEIRHRQEQVAVPIPTFVRKIDEVVIGRAPGMGVWLTRVRQGVPLVLLHHVQQNRVLHETLVLLTIVSDRRPRVPFTERHSMEKLGGGCYRIIVRLGFLQRPDIPLAIRSCVPLGLPDKVDEAHYYAGREIVVRRTDRSAMMRPAFAIFAFLSRITARQPDFFKIPNDAICELGFRIEI